MKTLSLLPLAITACAPALPPVTAEPLLATQCNPAAAADLIGKPFSDTVSTNASARTGATSVRVIRPGMAVTMDFRSDRLNITLDERGVVTGFGCN